MKIQVILEPSDEGGFTAIVPSLPGCISEGNTKEEVLKKKAVIYVCKSIQQKEH